MKTEIVKNIDAVTEWLNGLSDSELIGVHNEYCRENSYDDEIYSNNEDFFNTFFSNDVIKAVQAVSYGSYKYTDTYVQFNGQGNLDSSNSAEDLVSIDDIARAIVNDNFEPSDIELIEEEETEDED
jgi:hypothetical protein